MWKNDCALFLAFKLRCPKASERTNRHRHHPLRHGRRDHRSSTMRVAKPGPRSQAGHDAGATHGEDWTRYEHRRPRSREARHAEPGHRPILRRVGATATSATGPTATATATSRRACSPRGADQERLQRLSARKLALPFTGSAPRRTTTSKNLYDRNQAVYELMRYGVQVKPETGEETKTVRFIDWARAEKNDFAIAEEVTVLRGRNRGKYGKRPGYRAVRQWHCGRCAGAEALDRLGWRRIRQNLDNQKPMFNQPFFTTMQLVMAGNDTEGCATAPLKHRRSTTSHGKKTARSTIR